MQFPGEKQITGNKCSAISVEQMSSSTGGFFNKLVLVNSPSEQEFMWPNFVSLDKFSPC